MSTIIDSQIITFITGVVLYNFGTGSIKGCYNFDDYGIVFTAIIITRFLLKSAIGISNVKCKFFGYRRESK